jgi:hypothetical protein
MRVTTMVATAIVLSGCVAASTERFVAPDGAQALTTKCSQAPTACLQEATATCRGTYRVLDSYSKAGGLAADVLPGPVTWYYMTYSCGQADGAFPQFPLRGPAPRPISTGVTCTRFGNSMTCV